MSEQLTEEGHYFLPNVPAGTPAEEHEDVREASMGKPWARISYHPKMEMNMGLNLVRGLVIDFMAVFLLTWILMQFAQLNFSKTLMATFATGLIAYLTIPYLNNIWFEGPTVGYIIDLVVQWGLVGSWLGWFLNR